MERDLVFKAGEFEIISPGFCSLFQEEVSIHDTETVWNQTITLNLNFLISKIDS